jgi:conjugal transfer pilus assembly protein TraB
MAFSDIFTRKRRPLDEAEGEGVSPVGGELAGNEAVRRKQRMLLAGVAGVGLVLSSMWIFSGDEGERPPTPMAPRRSRSRPRIW